MWTAWIGTKKNFQWPKLWASNSWALGTLLVHLRRSKRSQNEKKNKTACQPMFGKGSVELTATFPTWTRKTKIPYFPNTPACLSLCLSCNSAWWSYPPLIICHFILPEPNLTNRGDNWGTRGMPSHNVYQLSVWVIARISILWYLQPVSLQRLSQPLCWSGVTKTMTSVSRIYPWDAGDFLALGLDPGRLEGCM